MEKKNERENHKGRKKKKEGAQRGRKVEKLCQTITKETLFISYCILAFQQIKGTIFVIFHFMNDQ